MQNWLIWVAPILASISAVLEAGTVAHLFHADVLVLIGTIAAAIAGFIAAIKNPAEPQFPTIPTGTPPHSAPEPKPPPQKGRP